MLTASCCFIAFLQSFGSSFWLLCADTQLLITVQQPGLELGITSQLAAVYTRWRLTIGFHRVQKAPHKGSESGTAAVWIGSASLPHPF